MNPTDTQRILDLSLALTSEKDREALLSKILDAAMDLAPCDAGTLYLLSGGALGFCRMFTRSQGVRQGGHDDPISLPPVPLEDRYVCGCCARHSRKIKIADVYAAAEYDFSGARQYDAMTGYRTKSMLVIPMNNEKGELLGVLQLINALDSGGEPVPFDSARETLLTGVASLAAICIANMQYTEQITALMESLVSAFSRAIDERSHYTANHTRTMAAIAERFLDWLEQTRHPWAFPPEKRRAFRMAVLLHDAGKLTIPLEVMDKATRLAGHLSDIEERLRVIGLLDRIAYLEKRISEDEYAARTAEREETLAFIQSVNRAGFLSDDALEGIAALSEKTYTDEDGCLRPWITDAERDCLLIRKGTLTAAERDVMQSHADVTAKILGSISFPKDYAKVPEWASSHHEFLNGSGYTRHLGQGQIAPETRLLTILDIFEALTAQDRPYKKPMPTEKALLVLEDMTRAGQLDAEILRLFIESRAWESVR